MVNENKESNRFWNRVKNIGLILSLVISIFALLLNVFAFSDAITKFWEAIQSNFTSANVQLWINIGNIVISAYFLIVFLLPNKVSGEYKIKWGEKEYDFCELAERERDTDQKTIPVESQNTLEDDERRVAALIVQYLWIIRLFTISLVLVYLAIIISSISAPQPTPNHRDMTNFAIAINIFNFLGGVVIFLGFWVLYSDTLNPQNKDNRFWVIPCSLALFYIALFIFLSWLFKPGDNAYTFLNRCDLFSGSINGLAMFLLFGRYVSLDQSLRETVLFKKAFRDLFKHIPLFETEKAYTKAVSFGIVFLLPIYALAQPLFGSLNISLYGEDPKVFQNTVYGICLVGKICFFHITYLLISKKLLHLYLYGLISRVGNFRKLEECLTTDSKTRD